MPRLSFSRMRSGAGARRAFTDYNLFPPILRVHSGPSAPDDAYVAVRYRNHWFWIDDRDTRMKSVFNSVLLLFSLTESEQVQPQPLVTIPTR